MRGLVYEVDPKGYVDRARRAAKDRGVSIRPCPDVMALLSARLPAPQAIACHTALKEKAISMRASGDPRTIAQLMADILFERLTGRSIVDGVDVEVGLVITDSALFDGTSESADLVGYGPIPAEMARDLLRPHGPTEDEDTGTAADAGADEGEDPAREDPAREDPAEEACDDPAAGEADHTRNPDAPASHDARPDGSASSATGTDGSDDPGVCPDGIRCSSWSCTLLHGSPEASPLPSQAGRGPQTTPSAPAPRPSAPPGAGPPPEPDRQRSAPPATKVAQVWLRRLWTDPATGALSGRDTRKRLFTGSLRAALIARDRTCRNTWCGAPVRAIDHKVRARDGGPTSDTNGQGLCQRCNNAREHPRARPLGAEDYRLPPPLLPTFLTDRALTDRAPPSAA